MGPDRNFQIVKKLNATLVYNRYSVNNQLNLNW